MSINNNNQQQRTLEINQHIRQFFNSYNQQPLYSVVFKSGLYLIKNVPSSRTAVLEYFQTLYDYSIALQINTKNQDEINNMNQMIDEIHQTLVDLSKNEIWSNELSNWSLEVIGSITNKFNALMIKQNQQPQTTISLNTIIDYTQIWNQYKPLRCLIELTQLCISQSQTREDILERLFLVSSKYSISFDWALCHFGIMCGSNELIIKLISILFRDYVLNQKSIQTTKYLPIINYFSNLYPQQMHNTIKKLFNIYLNLTNNPNSSEFTQILKPYYANLDQFRRYLIPFLLKLSLISTNIYSIMSYDLLNTLNLNNLNILLSLHKQYQTSNEINNAIFNDLKSILKQLNNDTYSLFDYLICLAVNNDTNAQLRFSLTNLIQSFLNDLNSLLLVDRDTVLFIDGLKNDYKRITNELLSIDSSKRNELKKSWLLNLITLIGIHGPAYITNSIMSILLVSKHNDLNNLIKFRQDVENHHTNCTKDSIISLIKFFNTNNKCSNEENINSLIKNQQTCVDLTQTNNDLKLFLDNLMQLHDYETKNEHLGFSVKTILTDNNCFINLIDIVNLTKAHKIINLYNQVGISNKLNIHNCLHFSYYLIKYFFLIIEHNEDKQTLLDKIDDIKCLINTACLKYHELLRMILLRTLIDTLFDECEIFPLKKKLLDASSSNYDDINNNKSDNVDGTESGEDNSLYKQNLQLETHVLNAKAITRNSFTKSFNKTRKNFEEKEEEVCILNYEFIELLEIICSTTDTGVTITNMTTNFYNNKIYNTDLLGNLAQLIVERLFEMIDYQWPEQEFAKLYIERDVKVQNQIEEAPLLWMIMSFIANNQVSFYKCSPIIRSLLSSLIIQWENVKEQPTRNVPKTLEITIKYLNLINKAQLLPAPLCYIIDIVPHINSYETHILLTIIWRYLKTINYSSSTRISLTTTKLNDKTYIEQIRFIFQRNIHKLAHLYSKFFSITQSSPLSPITVT